MYIFVVDDDAAIRTTLTDILEEEGYRVVTAADGHEALLHLRHATPHPCLIFLDLMMPTMSGWDFLSEQQNDPQLASIPVVVISAASNPTLKDPLAGATAVLPKPLELLVILETVGRYCARQP
jgi:CheY-like chemotaxis protein